MSTIDDDRLERDVHARLCAQAVLAGDMEGARTYAGYYSDVQARIDAWLRAEGWMHDIQSV